jgi:hypothetical protein
MSCPDPDALALVASGSGDAKQRQEVLDHAASCEQCHAAMVVLGPTADPGPSSASRTPGRILPAVAPSSSPGAGGSDDTIDRYLLGAELGRGAMGVVYTARDPELDREVAVKVLRPSASAARLKREAQALARLAHPNVVRVYDVGEHGGRSFVAMELVRGSNLRQWLRTARGVDAILAVLRQAGEGLAAAHRAGLVHRDVKPDNVFVADDGGVLVGDFGLARSTDALADDEPPDGAASTMPMGLASAPLTATGAVIGTPAYMAPEQNAGEATAASDQYAFCVMAWEALYGQRPISGASLAELHARASAGTITPPPAGKDVPPRVERAMRRGLSPSPLARFSSMDALLAELVPPVARRRWVVPAVGLGAVAAAAAVMLVGGGGDDARAAACRAAVGAIDADWTPEIATRVGDRAGVTTRAALAHYVSRWRERRGALCDAGAAAADVRAACLDLARVSFRQTVAGVVAASTSLQPDAIVRVLPALDRCEVIGRPVTAPPPAIAARVAALDQRITAIELGALGRVPQATRADVAALAAEARSLGFAPQILRVQLVDGIIAGLTGDDDGAIATFRAVMVAAEAQADDAMRARAGANLALVLARRRDPDTGATITAARAALARAGQDASIEILLLKAEAAYAFSREEYAAAAAAHERTIELMQSSFGPDAPGLDGEYAAASGAHGLAGDLARAEARSKDQIAFTERGMRALGAPGGAAVLAEDSNAPFLAGDFVTTREIGLRQLAFLRTLPVQEHLFMTQTMGTLARASDLDGDCNEAIRWYREIEALLRRPPAEISSSTPPDPAGVSKGLVDSLLGQGACLLELKQVDQAVTLLRAAEAEALARGAPTADDLPAIRRSLGRALVAAGRHEDAIAVLAPIVDGFPATAPRPFMRGTVAFALARSLWATGGVRDRERAQALALDAGRELEAAVIDATKQPALRTVATRARAELAALAAWRAAHPVE